MHCGAENIPPVAAGAAAHLMQPFPGSPPALFQPMPGGGWPQQMFANFGSPAAGSPQSFVQHPPPPPPPPPPQQQQQPQPAADAHRVPRLQTPTSPLSPAPSYRRSSRNDGALASGARSVRRASQCLCSLFLPSIEPPVCVVTVKDISCSAATPALLRGVICGLTVCFAPANRGEGGCSSARLRHGQRRGCNAQRRHPRSVQRLLAVRPGACAAFVSYPLAS